MSHTAMQEVFIKTVQTLYKQRRIYALWNGGLTHALQQRPLTKMEKNEKMKKQIEKINKMKK